MFENRIFDRFWSRDLEIRNQRGRFPPSGFAFEEFCQNRDFQSIDAYKAMSHSETQPKAAYQLRALKPPGPYTKLEARGRAA